MPVDGYLFPIAGLKRALGLAFSPRRFWHRAEFSPGVAAVSDRVELRIMMHKAIVLHYRRSDVVRSLQQSAIATSFEDRLFRQRDQEKVIRI